MNQLVEIPHRRQDVRAGELLGGVAAADRYGLHAAAPGRPKAKCAPSGGSDPRSGGAWGL